MGERLSVEELRRLKLEAQPAIDTIMGAISWPTVEAACRREPGRLAQILSILQSLGRAEADEARQRAERAEHRIELLEAVRNAAAIRAYECDCQGRDVKLDPETTIHLVMEGCSHDDALQDALDAAFAADYYEAQRAALAADQAEAGGER